MKLNIVTYRRSRWINFLFISFIALFIVGILIALFVFKIDLMDEFFSEDKVFFSFTFIYFIFLNILRVLNTKKVFFLGKVMITKDHISIQYLDKEYHFNLYELESFKIIILGHFGQTEFGGDKPVAGELGSSASHQFRGCENTIRIKTLEGDRLKYNFYLSNAKESEVLKEQMQEMERIPQFKSRVIR
ncbi:hypothetical protein [Flammeovirga sp. OC4]|uniref:hypothetical protein n=1 Tax=Flammeovirga sp. OC4 TaxID=1382345 RepID=UPI0005C60B3E|nr:hypothetical protein [Flammeovirga sp. OC4]